MFGFWNYQGTEWTWDYVEYWLGPLSFVVSRLLFEWNSHSLYLNPSDVDLRELKPVLCFHHLDLERKVQLSGLHFFMSTQLRYGYSDSSILHLWY